MNNPERCLCEWFSTTPSARRRILDGISGLVFDDKPARAVMAGMVHAFQDGRLEDTQWLSTFQQQHADILMPATPHPGHWEEALEAVRRQSRFIRLTNWSTEFAAIGPELADDEILSRIDKCRKIIHESQAGQQIRSGSQAIEAMHLAIEANKDRPGIPWGFGWLDQRAVLRGGEYTIIAARPSVGKTALALTAMCNQIQGGYRPGLVCFEMDIPSIAMRCVSQFTGEKFTAIRNGAVTDVSFDKLANSGAQFLCGRRMGIADVENAIRQMRDQGVQVAYVDYIQKILHPEGREHRERVAQTSARFKDLADELDMPIVVLAQLNRGAQGQYPKLSDLKETGAIEEDADVVVLIDRPDQDNDPFAATRTYKRYVMNPETTLREKVDVDMKGKAALILAKQRNEETGVMICEYDGPTMRFSDEVQP